MTTLSELTQSGPNDKSQQFRYNVIPYNPQHVPAPLNWHQRPRVRARL